MNMQQQKIDSVIVGLGTTGLSVARYLANQNCDFVVVDSRQNPPGAEELKQDYSRVGYHFGDFDTPWMTQAKQLIVNPGIAVATPEIKQAEQSGAQIIGDIELFFQRIENKPVIAITGSNGKTTVTSLLDLMAKKSNVKAAMGGNIGTPALDLLSSDESDNASELFILELSSYQLETTPSLQTLAAVILNVSEDHLDRYNNNFEEYAQAKAVIYENCEHIIYNREDAYSQRFAMQATAHKSVVSFGLNEPEEGHYGVRQSNGKSYLAKGDGLLMPCDEVKLPGQHNLVNSLAALALGEVAGLKQTAMLDAIREYNGMAHRTQWLTALEGIHWYNDSKGTNVGATIAALSGLPGKTVLIAGGQGKGADFSPLGKVIKEKAQALVLMGEDAEKIAAVCDESIPMVFVKTMSEAVTQAYQLAKEIEIKDFKQKASEHKNVLLSPACASFVMFKNYISRGESFIDEVNKLEQKVIASQNSQEMASGGVEHG